MVIYKNIKKIEKEPAHDGNWERKLLLSQKDNISKNIEAMTKWYLKPWKIFDWHSHNDIDEYFVVLDWIWTISFENWEEINYIKDDLIYIPANIKHKIEAKWDKENKFYFTRIII